MIIIDAEIVLSNFFLRFSSGSLNYGGLRRIRCDLERFIINNSGEVVSAYVQLDKNSLLHAIEQYPYLFGICQDENQCELFICTDYGELYNFEGYISSFNSMLEDPIKKLVIRFFDETDLKKYSAGFRRNEL